MATELSERRDRRTHDAYEIVADLLLDKALHHGGDGISISDQPGVTRVEDAAPLRAMIRARARERGMRIRTYAIKYVGTSVTQIQVHVWWPDYVSPDPEADRNSTRTAIDEAWNR